MQEALIKSFLYSIFSLIVIICVFVTLLKNKSKRNMEKKELRDKYIESKEKARGTDASDAIKDEFNKIKKEYRTKKFASTYLSILNTVMVLFFMWVISDSFVKYFDYTQDDTITVVDNISYTSSYHQKSKKYTHYVKLKKTGNKIEINNNDYKIDKTKKYRVIYYKDSNYIKSIEIID